MTTAAIDWQTRDSLWGSSAASRTVTMDDGGGAQSLEIEERSVSEAWDAIVTWGIATFGGSWSWTWSASGVVTLTAGVAVSATWGSALQSRLGVPASHSSGTSLPASSRAPAFVVATAPLSLGVAGVARMDLDGDASGDGALLGGVFSTQAREIRCEAVVSADVWATIENEARQARPVRVAHVYDPIDAVWYTCGLGAVTQDHDGPGLARVVFEVLTDA
jgi:hypothetical protein